ncbi:retropepsin-like aspartic protease [Bosea sp. (in: a-proteobacteria)]|uniref:retropepsin-like aspartic protease n=1 Tax=Bosea sp. (in: a-proteobacteria) TaxID=1871050 RepID=UPI004033FFB1
MVPTCPAADELKTVLCGTAQEEGSLHFLFTGTVNGHQARFLCDTGATHSFVSTAFALKHALPLESLPKAQQWSLADNTTLSCKQFATVDLCLPGHCATSRLTVMPSFVQGYDVLLGDEWLFANKATLSYESKTLSLAAGCKTAVTLPCPAVAVPKGAGFCSSVRPTLAFLINALRAKLELISATQASRWLLNGGRVVVAMVMADGSASASPGNPSDTANPHIPAAIKAELQALLNE